MPLTSAPCSSRSGTQPVPSARKAFQRALTNQSTAPSLKTSMGGLPPGTPVATGCLRTPEPKAPAARRARRWRRRGSRRGPGTAPAARRSLRTRRAAVPPALTVINCPLSIHQRSPAASIAAPDGTSSPVASVVRIGRNRRAAASNQAGPWRVKAQMRPLPSWSRLNTTLEGRPEARVQWSTSHSRSIDGCPGRRRPARGRRRRRRAGRASPRRAIRPRASIPATRRRPSARRPRSVAVVIRPRGSSAMGLDASQRRFGGGAATTSKRCPPGARRARCWRPRAHRLPSRPTNSVDQASGGNPWPADHCVTVGCRRSQEHRPSRSRTTAAAAQPQRAGVHIRRAARPHMGGRARSAHFTIPHAYALRMRSRRGERPLGDGTIHNGVRLVEALGSVRKKRSASSPLSSKRRRMPAR